MDGGEDWLEVCLYVDWDPEAWDRLTRRLEDAKVIAAEEENQCAIETDLGDGAAGDSVWYVHPIGYRLGGRQGPMVRWKLEREGIEIGVMKRSAARDRRGEFTIPNVHVTVRGRVMLASDGVAAVWSKVCAWIEGLGGTIAHNALSRVDPCVDLPGVSLDDLFAAYSDGRVITRARKSEVLGEGLPTRVCRTGRKITGFYIGIETQLCVYDKAEECRDPVTRALMEQKRWGGKPQDVATRIEFRLGREFLKDKGVGTVEDWLAKRAAVLGYLTTYWVRFVDQGFDRRHTNRAVVLPIWDRIANAFLAWAKGRIDVRLDPIAKRTPNVVDLVKQSRGCFERVCAILGVSIDGPDDFLGACIDLLHTMTKDDPDIAERIKRKRTGVD